ncbi:Zinc finger protein 257 [Dissostichus eleginoides]|uniref:Zinc finger protein 257 n=1 Tax=Dissostichus eleginoides TaxID=100907 RepID=A0AAD9BT37_DISEL|nr:Zinc finger protein 257 [Dissostichus eleginoides]
MELGGIDKLGDAAGTGMERPNHLLHDETLLRHTFTFLSSRLSPNLLLVHHRQETNNKETRTDANLPPIRYQSEPGNLLASLRRTEISIWQPAACPVACSLVAVTLCPERDILLGLGQRWPVLRDYPLAC